jgi:hypothetical protein
LKTTTIQAEAYNLCKTISSHPWSARVYEVLKKYTRNREAKTVDNDDPDFPARISINVSVKEPGISSPPASEHFILGDVAQRHAHQFAGYIVCHERQVEYSRKLGAFPRFETEEVRVLEWGHRTLREIAAKILEQVPAELRAFANPYARLNPTSLSPTPADCEMVLDAAPLVGSFLGHPSIVIIQNSKLPAGGEREKLLAYIDSLFVAANRYAKPRYDLLTPEQSLKIAEDSRQNGGSLEHLGTALFCLRDSLANLMQMLFCSFVFSRIVFVGEDQIFYIKPGSYGSFDFSYVGVAELLRLSPDDPFLLKVPHMGWNEPVLSFVNSFNMNGSPENGLELMIGFRRVDQNLSGFSNLL